MTDRIDALERLIKLRDTGVLTDDEYAAQKAALNLGDVPHDFTATDTVPWYRNGWSLVAIAAVSALAVIALVVFLTPRPTDVSGHDGAPSPVPSATAVVEQPPMPSAGGIKADASADTQPESASTAPKVSKLVEKDVRCRFKVGNEVVLSGECSFVGDDENIQLENGEGPEARIYVILEMTRPDVATVTWNGGPGEPDPAADLGTMKKDGSCWKNANGEVCIWPA